MEAIDYFKGNKLASDVWKSKYALHDEEGNRLEDNPDQMHKRMAKEFARISELYGWQGWDSDLKGLSDYGKNREPLNTNKVYKLFQGFRNIIPQGSIMYGLGNPYYITSLSNCVVLKDVIDSYGGILYSDQQLVQLMKRRCGVGVDISKLRPRGTRTQNAAKTSTGAVSFLKRFSDTTNEVAQEGRRGALMVTIDCRHPDVLEFIESKDAADKLTGANISVKWHNDFMEAAKNRETYTLRYPVDTSVEDAEFTKEVDAYNLVVRAAQMAHGANEEGENEKGYGGDPGCMFIDRMINYSTDCGYPNITVLSTNPCGEIGMDNDCCRLIALNLFSCVKEPFTKNAHIDVWKLERLAYEQQVLLDNLVDLEIEKIDRILEKIDNDDEPEHIKAIERRTWKELKESAIKYRRTGGGFTALGDTLAALGYEYGTKKSLEVVDDLMRAKFRGEWHASIDLAIQRAPFVEWHPDFDDTEFFDMMKEEFPDIYKRNMKYGRRNISLSTVAPTGSVSMLANINGQFGTTSGIEPVFSTDPNVLWHTRRKKAQEGDEVTETDENGIEWTEYKVFHEGFRQWLKENITDDPKKLDKDLLKSLANDSPYVTSAELDYKQRVDLQAVVQKYTTHSISSTLNLPEDEDWTTTKNIYEYAYDAGLKGVTIFRSGSKRGVLEGDKQPINGIKYEDAPKRPEELDADVHIVRDRWIVIVGLLDDKPYELFVMELDSDNPSEFNFLELLKDKSFNYSIIKRESKKYKIIAYNDEDSFEIKENILKYSPSSDADVLTRFVSMLMRHGVRMEFIVEQVEKADISVTDFSAVVNSVLKQYIETDELTCDNCGSSNVAYVEGCATCQECGSSKCG